MTDKPTLEVILDYLGPIDKFQYLVDELEFMCDGAISALEDVKAEDVHRQVGKVMAYREILGLIRPR